MTFNKNEFFDTSQIQQILKISSSVVLRLFKKYNILPAKITNCYGKSKYWWNKNDVEKIKEDAKISELRSKKYLETYNKNEKERKKIIRQKEQKQLQEEIQKFKEEFPTVNDCIIQSAKLLYSLNRFAKYRYCSSKEEIYALKNVLIKIFCDFGFVKNIKTHHQKTDGKICFACEGEGCERCYDGYFILPTTLKFLLFECEFNNEKYSWHQPKNLVNFKLPFTPSNPEYIDLPFEEKPIFLEIQEIPKAIRFLKYTISLTKNKIPKINFY